MKQEVERLRAEASNVIMQEELVTKEIHDLETEAATIKQVVINEEWKRNSRLVYWFPIDSSPAITVEFDVLQHTVS